MAQVLQWLWISLQVDHDTDGRLPLLFFQQAGITLGGFHVAMSQHFGYGINIGTVIELRGSVGMP